MSDDIETLREFIQQELGFCLEFGRRTNDVEKAIAALERVEKERSAWRGEIKTCRIATRMMLEAVEAERDALRAKLEKAKEVLEPLKRLADAIDDLGWPDDYGVENVAGCLDAGGCRASRAVLAELSADAPARQAPRDLRVLTDAELAKYLADSEKR